MLIWGDPNVIEPKGQVVAKQSIRPAFTRSMNIPGYQTAGVRFGSVLMGSGTGGTAPFLSPLLKACGLAETSGVSGGSSRTLYSPVSGSTIAENQISTTIYAYLKNLRHIVKGCYGTFTVEGVAGQSVDINFDFTGIWTDPTDNAPGAFTYPTDRKVLFGSSTASVAISGGSTYTFPNIAIRRFRFTRGVQLVDDMDIATALGYRGTVIVDAAPQLEMEFRLNQDQSELDFFANYGASATHNISFNLGSAAGNKVLFEFPKAQLSRPPQYGDAGGLRTITCSYDLTHTTDNSEFALSFF